jgi:acetylglutamate kinase
LHIRRVAEKLILLTNTQGLLNAEGELLTGLDANTVDKLITNGTIYTSKASMTEVSTLSTSPT